MFNSIIEKFSKFLKRTFCCFSLITLSMSIIGIAANTDELNKYMAVKQILTFFVFSMLFALSFFIADFIKNNIIIRRSVQFTLTYASLVVVFLCGGSFSNYVETNNVQNVGFSILSISFIFVIIYVVFAVIVLLSQFIKSKIENSSKEYSSILADKE